jgi:hypothetical protein
MTAASPGFVSMNIDPIQLNLLAAWIGILLGFCSGALIGTKFHNENWLGGYASFKRRMYRLGHVSFFGLAVMNLMFCFTAQAIPLAGVQINWAAWSFVVGAATMPACCVTLAHWPKAHALFAVPVVSLITASVLTIWSILLN